MISISCSTEIHLPRRRVSSVVFALGLALPCAAAIADATMSVSADVQPLPESITVANCNDSGPGSLREAIANAVSGDLVDLSNLNCSIITLSSGQIEIPQNDLYLKYSGEGGTPPIIEGNLSSRVFHHTGYGTLRLVGLTIREGKYDNTNFFQLIHANGGCIASSGNLYLLGTTVTACVARDTRAADAAGGGLYSAGTLTLSHSTVTGNTATSTARFGSGGGAFAHAAIDVEYSTVSGNTASGLQDVNFGGGLCVINAGTATSRISHSTLEGNRSNRGAGLMISGIGNGGASITIENSTISGNTANDYAAALYIDGALTLTSSTIASNLSASGPGVEIADSAYAATFDSSIIAGNLEDGATAYDLGDRGYSITIAGSNNLIVAANASIHLPPDTLSDDPHLLLLADNGGPTRTHALANGSPAIDAGSLAGAAATDQRGAGYARVVGARADIGAFEVQTVDDTIFADGFD